MVVADAARGTAGRLQDAGGHRERGEHRIEERDVDVLAAAGAVALAQGEQDAAEGVEAGEVVGHRDAGAHRRAVGLAGDVHESGLGLRHRVVARQVALRAVLAVAADRAVHEARIQRRVCSMPKPSLSRLPGLKFSMNTSAPSRRRFSTSAPFGALQVEREAALVAVDAEEVRAPAVADERPPRPRIVAGLGFLDLDHVGAHVAEQHRAERAGEDPGEVDDLETGERQGGWHARIMRGLRQKNWAPAYAGATAAQTSMVSKSPGRTNLEDLAVGRALQEVVLDRGRLEPGVAFLELEHAFADDLDLAPALQHVVELEVDVVQVHAAAALRHRAGRLVHLCHERAAGGLAQAEVAVDEVAAEAGLERAVLAPADDEFLLGLRHGCPRDPSCDTVSAGLPAVPESVVGARRRRCHRISAHYSRGPRRGARRKLRHQLEEVPMARALICSLASSILFAGAAHAHGVTGLGKVNFANSCSPAVQEQLRGGRDAALVLVQRGEANFERSRCRTPTARSRPGASPRS